MCMVCTSCSLAKSGASMLIDTDKSPCLSKNDVFNFLIDKNKSIAEELVWQEQPNNSNFYFAKSTILDGDGIELQGFEVFMRFCRGSVIDTCNYSIGWRRRIKGVVYTGVRMDIYSPVESRHAGLFGAHLHIGGLILGFGDNGLCCESFDNWFEIMCKLSNLSYEFTLNNPYTNLDTFKLEG